MTRIPFDAAPELAAPRQIADDGSAPAAVSRLYDDIRATLDTSIVNLVFRRLAGIDPQVLEAVWDLLRPGYISGRIAERATALARRVADDVRPVAARLGAIPAKPYDLEVIRALILGYNENNARNLVAFSALLNAEKAAAQTVPAILSAGLPAPGGRAPGVALPSLPTIEALPDDIANLVRRLNRLGDTQEPGNPIASLYLHLTHWPELLALAETMLAPLDAEGTLARWRETVRHLVSVAPLPELAAPPDLRRVVEPVLGGLVRCTLPKMIPIGFLLHALVAPTERRTAT